jgi:exopolysaccharide/PEP-CTERM locus tyrosine autokinase
MSKIAKAIEKAKRNRKALVKEVEELRLHDRAPARAPSLVHERPAYSQTRVVSLDKNHLERHRLLTLLDDPVAIDTYNVLCTRLLESTRPKGHNTIMVTSCADGEGKSLTTINLAVSIARRLQHTVLLVDTDLRKPAITRYLGLNIKKGLSDYLKNNESISDLLINPGLPKIVVLPAGKPIHGSTEFLGSPKMEKLVWEMKNRYPERYVIFDCPPLLGVPDSLVFSTYVDEIILLVEAGKTSREQIHEALKLLNGKPLLGLVMNKFKGTRKGYYQYAYGRS